MIAYRYDASANPDGAFLPGVPLRDLTVEDLDALPEALRRSVPACPWYVPAEPAEEGLPHG